MTVVLASPGEDPAVLTWRCILAPTPRPEPTGRHWWRELVTAQHQDAMHAWERQAEAATHAYATELDEYAADHPRPRLADMMTHLSQAAVFRT